MEKINYKIKFIIIIFGVIFIISSFTPFKIISNAVNQDYWTGEWRESNKTSSDGIPNTGEYQPTIKTNPITRGMLQQILGILQVIGIIGIVIAIVMLGFKILLGSASDKAIEKEKIGGILIATILITSGISIAKFIISIME